MESQNISNITVSVIVPVYNGALYIDSLVNAVKQQSYSSMELIFVDDGSTDDTYHICRKWEKKYSWIRAIHTDNHGVSHARNTGIDAAKGDWIQFLDVDDSIKTGMLHSFDYIANTYSGTDLMVCGCERIYKENRILCGPKEAGFLSGEQMKTLFDGLEMENRYWLLDYCWNKWYKKAILDENRIRFPQEISLGEDFVFNSIYMNHVGSLYLMNDCYYEYLVGDTGLVSRFQNQPWISRMPLYTAQKSLYESMGLWDKNRLQIEDQYGQILFGDIRTVNSKRCHLSQAEKKEYMGFVIGSPFYSMILSYLKSKKSLAFKVYFFVCKMRKKSALLWLIQLEGLLRK